MNITITTLVENTVSPGSKGLIGEHGLSFMIETGPRRLLFDTGQGLGLLNNARILGIDPDSVDTVILSHGHYDHAGGLPAFLDENQRVSLIAHPDIFDDKLAKESSGFRRIGMPVDRMYLQDRIRDLRLEKKPVEICPGVMTTGEIPMVTDFEAIEPDFHVRSQTGDIRKDLIADDQSLILETPDGLVVVLGCCHRGIINTLEHVLTLTGHRTIHAIMGGLHLGKASDDKLKAVAGRLKKFGITAMVLGHCTGTKAIFRFFNEFPGKVSVNMVGHVMRF